MNRQAAAILILLGGWISLAQAINPWVDTRHPRERVTVDYLFESCSVVGETAGGLIPFFDCESYVYGVLDSYLSVRASIPEARRACFPPSIAPWQALKEAEARIGSGRGGETAAPVLIEALRQQYPCGKPAATAPIK